MVAWKEINNATDRSKLRVPKKWVLVMNGRKRWKVEGKGEEERRW
jgi:hypothetical protein